MRRAALALLLLAIAPPVAAATPAERDALKAAVRAEARTAGPRALLPPARRTPPSAALARTTRPARVLIGVRDARDLAHVTRTAQRLGTGVRVIDELGLVVVTAHSPAALVRALRADPSVAYVEANSKLRMTADPAGRQDPETGIAFDWAFDAVQAGPAIAAAGGGSRREVATVDTGADTGHPDLAGRLIRSFDTRTGTRQVIDLNGHGTFLAGLIAAVDGNGIGGKGVAGNTRVIPIRASLSGEFTAEDLMIGIRAAFRRRADVLNLSLAGNKFTRSQVRALEAALARNVLPVAASGNRGDEGNPLEFPGALVGGRRGRRGIGLSVAAVGPDGRAPSFSAHNRFVSVAAPGAQSRCRHGVFSTIPRGQAQAWDGSASCPRVFGGGGGRWAYGQGTSFAAAITSGIAALVWQVERRLDAQQVAHVITRSARRPAGAPAWNEFTGSGQVDGAAAVALARTYDISAPRARVSARRRGATVVVRHRRTRDRTLRGREVVAGVRYSLLVSRNSGRSFRFAVRPRRRPFRATVRLLGRRTTVLRATACDSNGNCDSTRLRYPPR